MSVTVPNTVKKFKTLESDFGTTVAQALLQKAAQLANYMNKAIPIGKIMVFHSTQNGLPVTPDSRYWKLCDGTTISNANSPLNGQTVPNIQKKFIRHPTTGDTLLNVLGADTRTLTHNHSGNTAYAEYRDDFQLDNGDTYQQAVFHRHPISTTTIVVSILPPYRECDFYMRIA